MHMTKQSLIDALKNEIGISRKEAASVVNIFFNQMSDALVEGERIEIRGFCSLYVKKYAARPGRNLRTGESIIVPAKKLPFFKCGNELKKRVDY